MASSNRRLLSDSGAGDEYDWIPPPPPSRKLSPPRGEIAGIVIGGALFSAFLFMILARYFLKRSLNQNSRTRNPPDSPPILFDTQEDFFDEEQGPQLDHPIWYIRTIGLDRSIIDSIGIVKYKAGEGLIEGTECSVCLGEFGEDESLRLLPKCSHAFHVPCIDTWLESHKNCPLCRAPIIRAGGAEQASLHVPNGVGSSSNAPVVEENLHPRGVSVASNSRLSLSRIQELEPSETANEDSNLSSSRIEDRWKIRPLHDCRDSRPRVVSDLGDHRRVVGNEIEPVRRSVSLDSPSAAEIHRAVAIAVRDQCWGSSASTRQGPKMKSLSIISSSSKIRRSGSGSSSLYRIVKSCSFGASLHKEPISMKRSFSSIGNVRSLGK